MPLASRPAASLAALAALAGCGGSDAVKPSPLPEFKPTADARVAWRASVGSSKEYVFFPALRSGAIYAAAYDGNVTRLDAANGKQVWRVDTGLQLSGGVGAETDLVLVGSDKGVVVAYSLEGKELWRSQVSSEVLSVPRALGNLVIVRSRRRPHLRAGCRQWRAQMGVSGHPSAAAAARRIRCDAVARPGPGRVAGRQAGRAQPDYGGAGVGRCGGAAQGRKRARARHRRRGSAGGERGSGLRRGLPGPDRVLRRRQGHAAVEPGRFVGREASRWMR